MNISLILRASMHALLDKMMEQPLVAYYLMILILNPSFFAGGLFVLSVAFFMLTYLASRYYYDKKNTLEALRYVETYRGSAFYKEPIENIISLYDNVQEVHASVLPEGKERSIGWFYTLKNANIKTSRIGATTAFHREMNESFIISPNKSIATGVCSDFEKFTFFHELGHLSNKHNKMKTMLFDAVWQAVVILFVLASALSNTLVLLFCFGGVLLWLFNYVGLFYYAEKRNLYESIADGFAICRFREQKNFDAIDRLYKKKENNKRQLNSFEWFKDWANDPVEIPIHPLINRWIPIISRNRIFEKRAVNFRSAAERYSTPKLYVNVILLLSLILGAYYSSVKSGDIYIFIFLLFVIPFIVFLRLMFSQSILNAILEKRLRGEWTDGPIDKEINKIIDLMP